MTSKDPNNLSVFTIDIGTSGIRAALFDVEGNPLPGLAARSEYGIETNSPGGSEADFEQVFHNLTNTIDELLTRVPGGFPPPSYGAVSCFWHSLLGVGGDGNPVTKVFTWAETRPADQVEALRERIDEAAVHARTGCRFHSSYWPAKILWLRERDPVSFENTAKWVSLSDLIYARLFGGLRSNISIASGTGVFDIRKCDWDPEICSVLGIGADSLAPLAEEGESYRLIPGFAERWPVLKNTEWHVALGDGAANNIGSGCVTADRGALMIGTSGALRVGYSGDPPESIPDGLWCYRIDRKRPIIGGALSDGGGLYRWLRENIRLPDEIEVGRRLREQKPGGHGLTFLPFIHGERSTGYHESARGAILGLTQATNGIDILQAAMESVGYRFAEILKQLEQVCRIREIYASGGALLASEIWAQIIADVIGRELKIVDVPEASSRGAALWCLETAGMTAELSAGATMPRTEIKCNLNNHKVYEQAARRHREYYEQLVR